MATADLFERLAEQAEAQASAILRDAETEAAALLDQATRAAARERARRLELREATERAALTAEVEQRRRGFRQELLVARHEAVDAVLARVREAIPGLVRDPRYLQSVGSEFDEALEMVAGAEATLRAPAPVADALASRRLPGISVQVDPDLAGFRLTTTDGGVEILATLEERLRRLLPRLRIELGRELEEAEG